MSSSEDFISRFQHSCPFCDRQYLSSSELTIHVSEEHIGGSIEFMRSHPGSQLYQCMECGDVMARQDSLEHHKLVEEVGALGIGSNWNEPTKH